MCVLGRILDGIDTVVYDCAGAVLLIGSGAWIFMKVAEVDPNLAIAGAFGLVSAIGGAAVRDQRTTTTAFARASDHGVQRPVLRVFCNFSCIYV